MKFFLIAFSVLAPLAAQSFKDLGVLMDDAAVIQTFLLGEMAKTEDLIGKYKSPSGLMLAAKFKLSQLETQKNVVSTIYVKALDKYDQINRLADKIAGNFTGDEGNEFARFQKNKRIISAKMSVLRRNHGELVHRLKQEILHARQKPLNRL